MVTTRGADPFTDLQKSKCAEYFDDVFGQDGFIRTRRTDVLNSSGRLKTQTTSTLSLTGDLQFVSVKDYQILKEGLAEIGDGLFYAMSSYDVVVNDEITTPAGVVYRLTAKVEGETTKGTEIYMGFVAKRLNE